ncbi:MAG TPA: hypothetical protein P5204_11865 [Kiritimatiellia bacterium]|nr:hypothetical protein [Kiritimatiellia bacterium]
MTQRIPATIVWMLLSGMAPAFAQSAPPESAAPPAAATRADEIDARFGQADLLIRQINRMIPGPERSAAVEDLRGLLADIDATYTAEEKTASARRKLEALRVEVERQRQRLKQSGIAMAQANNAEPPDLAAIQATGSDYTLQEAILKALEEKERKEARRQTLGTSEALRLMQEVE